MSDFPQTPRAAVRSRAAAAIIGHWQPSTNQERGGMVAKTRSTTAKEAKREGWFPRGSRFKLPGPLHPCPQCLRAAYTVHSMRMGPILPRGSIPSTLPAAGTHEDVPFLCLSPCWGTILLSTVLMPGQHGMGAVVDRASSPSSCFEASKLRAKVPG